MIAGKGPAGAIGTMLARSQAHDQQAGVGIAERGNGPAEIAWLLEPDGIEKSGQTGAAPARGIKSAIHVGRVASQGHKKRATRNSA